MFPSIAFLVPAITAVFGCLVLLEAPGQRGGWFAWGGITCIAALIWTIVRHGEAAAQGWIFAGFFTAILFFHFWAFWRETRRGDLAKAG